jgi:hypothetical protein
MQLLHFVEQHIFGSLSVYAYYTTLLKLTDSTFLVQQKSSYDAISSAEQTDKYTASLVNIKSQRSKTQTNK